MNLNENIVCCLYKLLAELPDFSFYEKVRFKLHYGRMCATPRSQKWYRFVQYEVVTKVCNHLCYLVVVRDVVILLLYLFVLLFLVDIVGL